MKLAPSLSRGAVVAGAAAVLLAGGGAAYASVHWDYSEQEEWGALDDAYATCADGTAQSPIDIETATTERRALKDITVNWNATSTSVANNGHTVVATAPANAGSIVLEGVRYQLLQMHFHARSEHEVNGRTYPVEVHFVSKAQDGSLAVIGVFLQEGPKDNAAWAPLLSAVSAEANPSAAAVTARVAWRTLLPANQQTYRYAGSLTTPPCSEGVHWNVMKTPVELSARQIAAFTDAYSDNYRFVQALNGRSVVFDTSVG